MRISRLTLVVLTFSFIVSGASAPSAKADRDTGDCVAVEYTLPWNTEAVLGVEVRSCSSTRQGIVRLEEKLASGGWNPLSEHVIDLEPGEVVWGGFCARDGVHEADLVAMGPESAKDCAMIEAPRLAWRVDLCLNRLEPANPEGIICDRPC